IQLSILFPALFSGLEPEWKDDFVVSKSENGVVVLVFSDNLPDYLKPPNDWVIRYTDDPEQPQDQWMVMPSDSATLTRVVVPDMEPGTYYYLVVDSPDKGIQTPTLLVMTPKPPSEIRVGSNINDESVVDFKEAITSQPVKKYTIKVWKVDDPTTVKHYETSPDVSSGVVLDGLEPDTDYAVQVAAEFHEGDNLPSEPVTVRTPPGGVTCDCAHACTFEEKEDGTIVPKCYCHSGFMLSEDQKSCEPSTDAPTTYTIVRVTPPAFSTERQPEEILTSSRAPGDEEAAIKSTLRPTDATGRELPFVVGPDGVPLKVNAEGELVDSNQNPIIIDDDGIPRDPFGKELPRNKDGAWIYPLIDKSGKPLPVDANNMPIIRMVDIHGEEIPVDESGRPIDSEGLVISIDSIGRPLDQYGRPYPINEEGYFVVQPGVSVIQVTDSVPEIPLIIVDGEPVHLDESGHYVDSTGTIIPTNEEGVPIDQYGEPLKKNKDGDYVLKPVVTGTDRTPQPTSEVLPPTEHGAIDLPTDESGQLIIPIVHPDGSPLPTDESGNFITRDGTIIEKDDEGRPLGPDGEVLPTDDAGHYIYPALGPDGKPLPTDQHRRPIHPVLGPDGSPLPTDESGHPLGEDGQPIPTDASGTPLGKDGEPLPTDSSGQYVVAPSEGAPSRELPTDESGNVIYPIKKPDGSPLPTDASGNFVTDEGTVIEKDEEGRPLGPDGEVLPTDDSGDYIYPALGPDGKPLPTDEHRRPIHPVLGPDGSPLPTDESGHPLGEDGQPIPTDASGTPLGKDGEPLPTDSSGQYVATPSEGAPSRELPTDDSGKPLPTDEFGLPLREGIDADTLLKSKQCAVGEPQTETLLFIVESSHQSALYLGPIKELLKSFIRSIPERSMPKIGKIIYGATTEVTIDIGHYRDKEELVNSFDEIREIGGSPDANLALKIALQLLMEEERGATVVLHLHVTPLSLRDSSLAEGMRKKDVKLVHLDEKSWSKRDPNAFQKFLCLKDVAKLPLVTKPDGSPLPTDASGNYVTDEGTVIEKDDEGRPLGPDGQVLPTDESGNYIYPVVGPDGSPLPTDEHKRPIHPVLGPDGSPLPTDESGHPLGEDGQPLPTDASGVPVDKDGQPLPTDSSGHYVTVPREEAVTKELPTDESGNVIYPVTKPDGSPLPTDASGNFITEEGLIIGPDGVALPYPRNRSCSLKQLKMDILFAVSTTKVSKSTFDSILRAISKFADEVDLSPDVTRIGLVYGSKDVVVPLPLGGYQEKDHMRDEIRRIEFSDDGSQDYISLYGPAKQQFVMFPRADSTKIAIFFIQDEIRYVAFFLAQKKQFNSPPPPFFGVVFFVCLVSCRLEWFS
ncbi:hypothetical protein ANCCAN_17936, partial [Ancylostoma caninum]